MPIFPNFTASLFIFTVQTSRIRVLLFLITLIVRDFFQNGSRPNHDILKDMFSCGLEKKHPKDILLEYNDILELLKNIYTFLKILCYVYIILLFLESRERGPLAGFSLHVSTTEYNLSPSLYYKRWTQHSAVELHDHLCVIRTLYAFFQRKIRRSQIHDKMQVHE